MEGSNGLEFQLVYFLRYYSDLKFAMVLARPADAKAGQCRKGKAMDLRRHSRSRP